jgi:hypothetical protein
MKKKEVKWNFFVSESNLHSEKAYGLDYLLFFIDSFLLFCTFLFPDWIASSKGKPLHGKE